MYHAHNCRLDHREWIVVHDLTHYSINDLGKCWVDADTIHVGQWWEHMDWLSGRRHQLCHMRSVKALWIINGLKLGKASGPYSIPNDILKLMKYELATPLAEIVNLTFETGIYIERFKTSKVIPIYKGKGNQMERSNYRPISLLSNLNKIFEKIMHERVYET